MPMRRPVFNVHNFQQVVHDPQGTHLFGELMQAHVDSPHPHVPAYVIPAGTRVVINARKGDQTWIMFPHDVVNDPIKCFTDGDMRVVCWSIIRVLGRFNRKQFTGYPK